MNTPLLVHGLSDPGRQHATNEDSWSATHVGDAHLLVLCDGMGGMGRGAAASQLATDHIVSFVSDHPLPPRARLESAIASADDRLRKELCTQDSRPGCTAVSVFVESNQATVAWVGDSRVYWIREGRILERTTDHKVVQGMVERGELTEEQARVSRYSNVLSRSLGGRLPTDATVQVALFSEPWSLQRGDRLLLCSDGVVDLISDDEIPNLIRDLSPSDATKQLVDLANRRGGHDNITAIVAVWGDAGQSFVQAPFSVADTAEQATEGFAPSRGSTPSPAGVLEEEDEDDKATVLANASHELIAELLPPTPEPATPRVPESRPPMPTSAHAPATAPTPQTAPSGPPTALLAVGVFLAIVTVGGLVLWLLA